jgi:hypothetical protein
MFIGELKIEDFAETGSRWNGRNHYVLKQVSLTSQDVRFY